MNLGTGSGITIAAICFGFLLLVSAVPANAASNPRIVTVPAGNLSAAAVFDPFNGHIFVLNLGDNTVTIINGRTNTVIKTVPAGNTPDVGAFDLANGNVYVTDFGSDLVSVLSGSTGAILATISLGSSIGPQGIVYDARNGLLFVADSYSNTVSVINGATNTLVNTISVSAFPLNLAYDIYNGNVYLADQQANEIQVISGGAQSIIATISTPDDFAVNFDLINGNLYAYNLASGGGVAVIDGLTNTIVRNIVLPSTCDYPGGGVADLYTGDNYVICSAYGTTFGGEPSAVAVINGVTNKVVKVFAIPGSLVFGVVGDFDFENGGLYIPAPSLSSVDVIYPGLFSLH